MQLATLFPSRPLTRLTRVDVWCAHTLTPLASSLIHAAPSLRRTALRNSFSSHFPGSGSRPHGGCKRLKGMEPVKVSVDFFRTFDFSCHIGYVLLLIRHARCPIYLAIRL